MKRNFFLIFYLACIFIVFSIFNLNPFSVMAQNGIEDYLKIIQSKKSKTDFRRAQAYLARSGSKILPELEKLATTEDQELQKSLREVVSLLLLQTTPWKEFQGYPHLLQLCKPNFEKAKELALPLINASNYDSGEHGLMPPDMPPPKPSPERSALAQLQTLRGLAVPMALELTLDQSPFSRFYGAELLISLGALGQINSLEALQKDPGKISIFHGCYSEQTSVGEAVKQKLTSIHPFYSRYQKDMEDKKSAICFEAENYVEILACFEATPSTSSNDLINTLRREAKTMESSSWDNYWERAYPHLQKVWDKK